MRRESLMLSRLRLSWKVILENHFPFIRRAAITIRFGEPIDLKSLPREQKKQAGAYTRTIIQAMLDDILKED